MTLLVLMLHVKYDIEVLFGWRGPLLTEPTALKELTACAVSLRYLCDTAAAPLQRALVEREDALAGDVSYNLTENIASLIKIEL
ncbi:jg22528, partial [Pararge aegeria aegeria]